MRTKKAKAPIGLKSSSLLSMLFSSYFTVLFLLDSKRDTSKIFSNLYGVQLKSSVRRQRILQKYPVGIEKKDKYEVKKC